MNETLTKNKLTKEHFEIAKKNGISSNILKSRFLYQGFSIEDATTLPLGTQRKHVGREPIFTEEEVLEARKNQISKSLLYRRYELLGYTKKEAISMRLGQRRNSLPKGGNPE